MKKGIYFFLLNFIVILKISFAQQNVGVGTTNPHASAKLEVSASDKGVLIPRLTSAQRNAITSPATGLLVFDTDVNCFFFYNGTVWSSLCPSTGGYCQTATAGYLSVFINSDTLCNSIVYQNGNNIGINTTSPVVSVEINSTDAIAIPSGTTAQQPSGAPVGSMRFNTTLGVVEVFNGTCWQNVNTPPIGATYIQWFNAADPNTLYPCTQWVATDIANGEFIRARGGEANVAASDPLTGIVQQHAMETHQHSATLTINNATGLSTNVAGSHNHGGFTGGYNDIGTGCGNPKYIPYDDNTSTTNISASGATSSPSLTCPWNGNLTTGNFLGRPDNELNHNHSISTDGNHTHSIPDHNHTGTVTINNNSGNSANETRPTNVAVIFWRRVN